MGIHQMLYGSYPDWTVKLQTNQGGSYVDVTGTDDVIYSEGAPASGPDTTSAQMKVVIVNDPGGSPTYSWTRTGGSSRITANTATSTTTTFNISSGAYTIEQATFDCTVTISGISRSATTDGQVVFDGSA